MNKYLCVIGDPPPLHNDGTASYARTNARTSQDAAIATVMMMAKLCEGQLLRIMYSQKQLYCRVYGRTASNELDMERAHDSICMPINDETLNRYDCLELVVDGLSARSTSEGGCTAVKMTEDAVAVAIYDEEEMTNETL